MFPLLLVKRLFIAVIFRQQKRHRTYRCPNFIHSNATKSIEDTIFIFYQNNNFIQLLKNSVANFVAINISFTI